MKVNSHIEIKTWGAWRIAWVSMRNLPDCVGLLGEGEIDGFGVSPHHGSDITNLSCFLRIEGLRSLVMPFCETLDVEFVKEMVELRHLVVSGAASKVDLSGLEKLDDATLTYSRRLTLPRDGGSLRSLRLDGFKPDSDDLTELVKFRNLTKLELVKAGISSLLGITQLRLLRELDLHYLSKLKSILDIGGASVRKLVISHCKRVEDLDSVKYCSDLESLGYHDSASIPTISFIAECHKLEEFRFVGVDVIDGDMTPLVGLEKIGFTEKRHFNLSENGIRQLQAARKSAEAKQKEDKHSQAIKKK